MNYQVIIIILVSLVLITSYMLGFTPPLIGIIFLFVSLIAYLQYAKDKKAAKNGTWRVSENTLHLLGLFCGWPGALIAQQKFRHKTKKVSFRVVFWLTVIANIGGFVWLHSHDGNVQLRKGMSEIESYVAKQIDEKNISVVINLLTSFHGDGSVR
ncbi:DUF1294 domain-containing protein [Oleiphilus messinensis]|nr:DUF1294 domain-containing protein [Oleiphilus messinensis]